jgi:dTMP kinase
MKKNKGLFFTIEGGEGVGKSTFTNLLTAGLASLHDDVITTREPGGTPVADEIRNIFKSPAEELAMSAETLLIAAARSQHMETKVKPALARGAWVVCDRFIDSTRVYQGIVGGVQPRDIEWLIRFATGGLEPHLTFLLDCDPAVSQGRLVKRAGEANRYDDAASAFHIRVRQGFLRLAGFYPSRFYILDATLESAELARQALEEIERRFGAVHDG